MTIEYNKVTWYSKLLALILFVALPFIGFWLGMKYANTRAYILEGREIAREQIAKQKNSTSTEIDTTNWKIYRNEDYGFEIQHPTEWFIKDTSEGAGYASYEISMYPVNPDEYCGDLLRNSSSGFFCGVSPAIQIYEKIETGEVELDTWFNFDRDIGVNNEIIEKAISTFKFTDSYQTGIGIVQGKVSIGPICPVERIDMPCEVNPEVYTSRKAIIYKSDQRTVVQEKNLNSDGTYKFSLPMGEYYVNIIPQGIGILPPKKIVVIENKTTQLDFDIDTGIR